MKMKNENLWKVRFMWIAVILLLVILLYFLFRTDDLKNYKSDLEDELNQLKKQISKKQQRIRFLENELNRLKATKECIVDFAIRLYRTIKLIIFCALLVAGVAGYAFYNFNLVNAVSIVAPVALFCYYGINICIKNRVGDFGKALQFLQEYFVDIVFRLKKFDVSLINTVEAQLIKEQQELVQLEIKLASYKHSTTSVIK